jgi:hypothetical protein
MNRSIIAFFLIGLLVLVGCQQTDDTDEDPQAVQQLFPTVAGYTTQSTDNIQEAITTTLAGAGLGTGNFVATGLILKIDDFVSCMRDVGAFDVRTYVENPNDDMIAQGVRAPRIGVLMIVNQTRLMDNFGACIARNPLGGITAQSVEPEPCFSNGEFEYLGDNFGYLYGVSDRPLAEAFYNHLQQFGASGPVCR